MFPSECLLERRVRSDIDDDLAATELPLFILGCEDRKAEGYADDELEQCNLMLDGMKIGVRLADKPPAVSYMVILGSLDFQAEISLDFQAAIVAVDKNVIVICLDFEDDLPLSYLIYDAVALSLRMIPAPDDKDRHWIYTLTPSVSFARPCRGHDYSLVHTGRLDGVEEVDSLYLWRPSSSSPWSEKKKAIFPDLIDWSLNNINTEFLFNGHAYWVDLRCGVSYCNSDALFDDNISLVKFGFIRLPVKAGGHHHRFAEPIAYRTMGVVRDSFIRFVSIDGFQDYLKLKKRTVTVWKLLGHDEGWVEEYKFSLKTLWGFEGFGDELKDLTPMYPLLSTKNKDIVYLILGEYYENPLKNKFFPSDPRYMLAVDMRKKIVTYVPLEPLNWLPRLVSCGFRRYLGKALVGPCDDEGVLISMKKRRSNGGNGAEAHILMKKPRLENPICC